MDISVGFLSTGDAQDPRTWSGTQYFMARALAARVRSLHYFGPMPVRAERLRNRANQLRRLLGHGLRAPGKTHRDAALNAQRIKAHLARTPCDVLFAPAGATLVAEYYGDVPVVYSSDTTFRLMRDYYPSFSALADDAAQEGDQIEAQALKNSDLLLMPSQWAARSVISDYGIDPHRVSVMPFGVNMHDVPSREQALQDRHGPLRLLFVGVDWHRKGGPIFIETLQHLRAAGVPVEAVIVGCVPPQGVDQSGLTVIPYLDKTRPGDAARLSQLYLESDFLMVPSRQECFGIVYAEAAAHGTPPIGTETGGVGTVIRRDDTGLMLGPMARGDQYAAAILRASAPRDGGRGALPQMRASARDDYENRLNWDVWADQALALVAQHLAGPTA